MLHKSMAGLPVLLLAASCVPPAAAGPGPASASSARSPRPAATAPAKALVPVPPAEAVAPGQAAAPFVVDDSSGRAIAASLQCLTAAVYYEARSEGLEGQRAVAQVVLNRVRHPAFPKSVCGVVYQGSRRSTGCQFSFTCDGSMRGGLERGAWLKARRVAANALAGGVYGPVGLATHFHTTAIRPWWAPAMRRAVTVGSHIFYRWRGEWGDPKSFRRPYSGVETALAEAADPQPAPAEAVAPFGVTVHRGATPALVPAERRFGVRIHRPANAAGVRIHSGIPEPAGPEAGTAQPVEIAVR